MDDDRIELDAPIRSLRLFPAGAAADGSVNPEPPPSVQLPFYMSDLKSRPVSEPGGVPFFWEQKPGQPRNGSSGGSGRFEVAPKPPPGGISKESSSGQETLSASALKPGSSVRTRKAAAFGPAAGAGKSSEVSGDNAGTVGVDKENDQQPIRTVGEEEDDDDVFSDALDTLSRTESFFMNCSPDVAKTPSRVAADLHVQDFMMGRFLPAAQAMVSAPPQYASRKPSAPAQEQPSGRAVNEECRKPPPFPVQRTPYSAVQYVQHQQVHAHYGDNDDEDEEGDDSSVHLPSKGCGFLPHLCLKASFSLLNSVPGVKTAVGRLPSPSRRRSGSLQKFSGQTKTEESKHDRRNRLTNEFNQLAHCKDTSVAKGSSSYRNKSPHSPPHEARDFVGFHRGESKSSKIDGSKDDEGYWVITPHHDSQLVSDHQSTALEKHLDIDPFSVPKKDESQLSSFSAVTDSLAGIQDQRTEVSLKACQSDSLQPNISKFLEPFSSYGLNHAKLDGDKYINQKFNNIDTRHLESNCWLKKTVDPLRQPILPLPLPKSPSDSWLSRTLPSVASKHPVPQFLQRCQPRKQVQICFIDPKQQDSNAKTSKVQLRQVRFAEILAKPESPRSEI